MADPYDRAVGFGLWAVGVRTAYSHEMDSGEPTSSSFSRSLAYSIMSFSAWRAMPFASYIIEFPSMAYE